MKKEPLFVAISNQKGRVGKSAITIMLAGYFHYLKGLNVAVVDCDFPQFSLIRMKERDMRTVENSEYFRQLLVNQWNRIHKKPTPSWGRGGKCEGSDRPAKERR